ncbi:rCG63597 [Rattus norvegicus]|uniref:RCG63597 n=1 Tax=Rattus norvegicus TaxID=10116 RepID=A6J7Z8_RAT|nr:rCG63597 [Rattus norvegicus]
MCIRGSSTSFLTWGTIAGHFLFFFDAKVKGDE